MVNCVLVKLKNMKYSIKRFGLEISKLTVVIIIIVASRNIHSIEEILEPSKLIGFALLFLLVFLLAAGEMKLLKDYMDETLGKDKPSNKLK